PDGMKVMDGNLFILTLNDGLWTMDKKQSLQKAPVVLPSQDVTSMALHKGLVYVGTRGGFAAAVPQPDG
ncbi:MAG: hypothetical protein KKC99_03555, partial [Proteobacteria bacterium]|nr:hypothetical protein [Pseudomonadota bacterium]